MTGSLKYVGKAHLLRGRIALAGGDWASGEVELREALDVARCIEYPNLVWPAAHGLAIALASQAERERAARSKGDEAQTVAALAAATIRSIADRAPEAALRETFLAWTPVQTALEDLERVHRM